MVAVPALQNFHIFAVTLACVCILSFYDSLITVQFDGRYINIYFVSQGHYRTDDESEKQNTTLWNSSLLHCPSGIDWAPAPGCTLSTQTAFFLFYILFSFSFFFFNCGVVFLPFWSSQTLLVYLFSAAVWHINKILWNVSCCTEKKKKKKVGHQ